MKLLKTNKHNILHFALYFLLFILPLFIVFKSILTDKIIFGGDAPFFYENVLRDFLSEPLAWVERGVSFGGPNLTLWLSPFMLMFGVFNKVLSFSSNQIIKILFYFPSFLLSIIGIWLLARQFSLSKLGIFFSILFYIFNTYYILLVDGGQVGVVLAYGFFPLVIFFGNKLFDKTNVDNFLLYFLSALAICIVDPRIYIISLVTLSLWYLLNDWKKIWLLIIGATVLIGINYYWLYPMINSTSGLYSGSGNTQFLNVLNSLLLYSPHWPQNVFGKIIQPQFYFFLIPILIFSSYYLSGKKKPVLKMLLIFLILGFLAKGDASPLGSYYSFIVNKLPFGFALRDSSKFFVSLLSISAILVGVTVTSIEDKISGKIIVKHLLAILLYLYLLITIFPALCGKMNFILSKKQPNVDFDVVKNHLLLEDGGFRTLWFSEKNPLSYESISVPAVNAQDLVNYMPFMSLNASEDPYNFLYRKQYTTWLKILGVKYIFLTGNPRVVTPTNEDNKNWNEILSLVDKNKDLVKKEWGTTFPIYEIKNIYPKAYGVDKIIAVVGPFVAPEGNEDPIPAVYFEDGKFDPVLLNNLNPDSVNIYFNNKNNEDLAMSLLQQHFKSVQQSTFSEWAMYEANQQLKYKYELLIRGYQYSDLDYSKGIAFSTKPGEKIIFDFDIKQQGKYIIAKRIADAKSPNLYWIIEDKYLDKGKFDLEIVNNSSLKILNVTAVIPEKEFKDAQELSNKLLAQFGTVKNMVDLKNYKAINLEKVGTLKYRLDLSFGGYWIVFSENYNDLWQIKVGNEYKKSVPIYSMINGFYVEPKWNNVILEYLGQKYFRWGIYVSSLTIIIIFIMYFYLKSKNHD